MSSVCAADVLRYSLLDEPLIRYRRVSDGLSAQASLPQLFVALGEDAVRDFPALRPHQRHPWHAFLVQLAAIALHKAECTAPWANEDEWRTALLALTPDDPDGAAWCLVSPPDRPALLQAAVPEGSTTGWLAVEAPDQLDMLITSRNHDLKASRMRSARPDDWLYALVSLQTQEGWGGRTNYGISRMNSGYGSRPSLGTLPKGCLGARWWKDVKAIAASRSRTSEQYGLREFGGLALVWTSPWDGSSSLSFDLLDPHYIEICRRIRLNCSDERLVAFRKGTGVARIDAASQKGRTGDGWAPINTAEGTVLSIRGKGFDYELLSEILFKGSYTLPPALSFSAAGATEVLFVLAQGVARGQSETDGYHERRVPLSAKVRGLLASQNRPTLERISSRRIGEISEVQAVTWKALTVLFNNGVLAKSKDLRESVKSKATDFARPFEEDEDARFFGDLNDEVDALDPAAQHLAWLDGLVHRAEIVLRRAFIAGPRSGMHCYRAQAAALSLFHGALRGEKSPLPDLANHYRQQAAHRQEDPHEFHVEPTGG